MFIQNFQFNVQALRIFASGANIQYICTIVCGEALCQLDTLSIEVDSTTIDSLNLIIFCFRLLLFPVNALSKAKARDSPRNKEAT